MGRVSEVLSRSSADRRRSVGPDTGTQAIAEASGIGRTLSVSCTMMPSVPIEPVRSLGKS